MLQNYQASLLTKKRLAKDIYCLEFKLEQPQILNFNSGQYLLLDVKQGYRQYSISSSPSQDKLLQIIVDVKPMGPGSQYLLNLKVKDQVSFRAPLGVFTLKQNHRPIIFLAAGAGIAPIKSMILTLTEQHFSKPLILLWGLRTKADLYFTSLWEQLKNTVSNFNYYYCFSQEQQLSEPYFSGHIQDKLSNLEQDLKSFDFYLCARQSTVDSLKNFLINRFHLNPLNLYHEKFT